MKKSSLPTPRLMACLGEVSRFDLVRALAEGSWCVTELADQVGLSQSCTTRHLQALEREGVVRARRDGKRVFYGLCLEQPRVADLIGWALSPHTSEMPPAAKAVARTSAAGRANAKAGSPPARPSVVSRLADRASGGKLKPAEAPNPLPNVGPEPATEPASAPEDAYSIRKPPRSGDLEDFLL